MDDSDTDLTQPGSPSAPTTSQALGCTDPVPVTRLSPPYTLYYRSTIDNPFAY
eukprot:gene26938-4559_t